jgi:hypothetical protein
MWNVEEIRRRGAYHEAAHAVVDVVLGRTVHSVSMETEGRDYRDTCVTAVTHMESESMRLIPVAWDAQGHATSTIAANMAMFRAAGKRYPWDSWQEITTDCEDIEKLGDPDALESDTMKVREYCEAAARFGQMVKMPASDELPEGAPPLPQMPSTGREAFEIALREAERLLDSYWWAIAAVAERLAPVMVCPRKRAGTA